MSPSPSSSLNSRFPSSVTVSALDSSKHRGEWHNCAPLCSEEVHTIFNGGCSRLAHRRGVWVCVAIEICLKKEDIDPEKLLTGYVKLWERV